MKFESRVGLGLDRFLWHGQILWHVEQSMIGERGLQLFLFYTVFGNFQSFVYQTAWPVFLKRTEM